MKQVCVFGSSSESIDPTYLGVAEQLGSFLAKKNCGVIFGAGKYGVMGAVARGVRKENGALLGVSPDFFVELNVLVEDYGELVLVELNVLVEDYGELVLKKTMHERKALMEDKADAFVICAGGIGTLEEFFEVITLKQLGRHSKPIIILNTLGFYDPMLDMIEQSVAQKFMSPNVHKLYSVANSIDEVWEQLESYRAFSYNKYS